MNTMNRLISTIDIEASTTWQDSFFLTFDIDWAHDVVLSDTIDLIEQAGVSATWFITHETPLLERLRTNPNFELGIHPNFNFLLNGAKGNGTNAKEVLDRLMAIVPEAKSVRSHSMTQNSPLLDLFKEKGLSHDCNVFIPEQSDILLKPWKLWNGLTRVPYFWEDDVACMYEQNTPIEKLAGRAGLKVFDFHPIHIFLNTESLDRYERTRHLHQKPEELIKNRFDGKGARTKLLKLLELVGGKA